MSDAKVSFDEWCVLELMGHRKLAGKVTEHVIAGQGFLRLDIPEPNGSTQFYSPSSVYCITPVSENTARAFAAQHKPEPVTRWEIPQLTAAGLGVVQGDPIEEFLAEDDDEDEVR